MAHAPQLGNELYTAQLLDLAAQSPRAGHLPNPQAQADAESRLCGSRIHVELSLDAEGCISEFAHDTQACALGQAATAIVAQNIIGQRAEALRALRAQMQAMLQADGAPPQGVWQELRALQGVKAYPQRHGSVLLVFVAIEKCLDSLAKEARR